MSSDVDVVVIGAGIAGSIAALLLAQRGLHVTIVDKKADDSSYKLLCTHCVQPVAMPVLRKLGLEPQLLALGGVPTKMAVRTRVGMIDPDGDTYDEAGTLTALNIERRLLDPFLIAQLRANAQVRVEIGTRFVAAERNDDGDLRVQLESGESRHEVRCRLLVAADGRGSPLARAFNNPEVLRGENDRICVFAYFEGIAPWANNRTLYFIGRHDEHTFCYPLGHGRTLLATFLPKELHGKLRTQQERMRVLLEIFDEYPECPPLTGARAVSEAYGYLDYPNILRQAAVGEVAFIGDAALSLDPMSGSGCAFAIVSADMLVEQVADALLAKESLRPGIERYAQRFDGFFKPRAQGIAADSRLAKSQATLDAVHRRICADTGLQRAFLALIGRLATPGEFQRAFLLGARRREVGVSPA